MAESSVTGYIVRWYNYMMKEHQHYEYGPSGLRVALEYYSELQRENGHKGRVGAELVMTTEQVLLNTRNDPDVRIHRNTDV